MISNKIKALSYLDTKSILNLFYKRIFNNSDKAPGMPFDEFVMFDTLSFAVSSGFQIQKLENENILTFEEMGSKTTSVHLRRNTTDFHIFNQVFRSKEYEGILNIAKEKNLSVKYIMDAGANCGCSTLYFHAHFPEAEIIAIEPEDHNFKALQRSVSTNPTDLIHTENKGLWNKDIKVYITNDFRDGREYAFQIIEEPKGNILGSCEGITIQSLMDKYKFPRIDILKIDIEGAERYLFENPDTATNILKNVSILALEIHDEVTNRQLVMENLKKNNFTFYDNHETLFAFKCNL